ncbi:hypothetical protein XM50_05330 [Sphingomonas sp. Ag1]|nr:hypothetical protein XM50_05330 [Sphingomonas sp. Ag1]
MHTRQRQKIAQQFGRLQVMDHHPTPPRRLLQRCPVGAIAADHELDIGPPAKQPGHLDDELNALFCRYIPGI